MNTIIKELKHNVNDATQKTLTLVLLAAGKSSRFNGIKLAQPIVDLNADGVLVNQPLLLHSLDKLNYLADYLTANNIANNVVVVLGSHHSELSQLLPISTTYITNDKSDNGLSTSVKVGVEAAISTHASGLLLALGDHIGVTYTDYMKLADLWVIQQSNVCASYQAQLGVPAIFTSDQFSALTQLKGDQGAKPVLQQLVKNKQLTCLDLPNAINDIDTRNDLLQWQQLQLNNQ
ncbi:nucleotidyltransferase family protein [Psychromonas ingrahamii]|uniref:nucleotidyltransferase family protein n=1 Tax=Psychromonas ingrahamii TaxID=357794 RepID=UPI0018DD684A|nr:nucleotidyltransferase family protein [Psychromonas ingrahamii]